MSAEIIPLPVRPLIPSNINVIYRCRRTYSGRLSNEVLDRLQKVVFPCHESFEEIEEFGKRSGTSNLDPLSDIISERTDRPIRKKSAHHRAAQCNTRYER